MSKTASELTRNGQRKLIKKLTRQRREAERRMAIEWCCAQGFKGLVALLK